MKFDRNQYFKGKFEGKLDKEIARDMGIAKDTLTRYKKLYNVYYDVRTRKNKMNISECDIQRGIKNGIPRDLILKRCRNGFSVDRAITSPVEHGKRRVK